MGRVTSRIDTIRRSPRPAWIDTLVFLALMSGPPKFRDRETTASLTGSLDAVVLLHVVVWAAGACWVFVRLYPSLLRRGVTLPVNRAQIAGAFLIAGLLLSLWQSPGVLLTAFTLGQFAIMLLFAWQFVGRYGPSSYLRHVFAGVCVLTIMLIATAILMPDVVVQQGSRLRGERIAQTGSLASLGLVFCLASVPRRRTVVFWSLFGVFGVLLAMSRARTAFVGMAVYLAIGFLYGRGLRVRRLVPLLLAAMLALVALDDYATARDYVVRDSQTIETLSDRVPLWTFLTKAVMRQEPIIGFGYYAGSRLLAPQYNDRLGNAHSAFFEFLVGGGIVGAGLYVALSIALLSSAIKLLSAAPGQPDALIAAGLLVVALTQGITSTEATHAGPVGFCFWSLTALLPALRQRARTGVSRPARVRSRLREVPADPAALA